MTRRSLPIAALALIAALIPVAAQAACGRTAQAFNHILLNAVEKMPWSTQSFRDAAYAKAKDMTVVQACPDDSPSLQKAADASYAVYVAWQHALIGSITRLNYRQSTSTTLDRRCAPAWDANVRETIASDYRIAFSPGRPRKTSADDAHVIAYLQARAAALGFKLPRPYHFSRVVIPIALQLQTVQAHLPPGVTCIM